MNNAHADVFQNLFANSGSDSYTLQRLTDLRASADGFKIGAFLRTKVAIIGARGISNWGDLKLQRVRSLLASWKGGMKSIAGARRTGAI